MDQLQLQLFPRRAPTWKDVHDGTALLVTRIEPCDRCAEYWRGKCTHTADNYAYPRYHEGGLCARKYIEWRD